VLENRVLRKIFGPKRDGVMRGVEKTTWREALWYVLLTKYYLRDKSGSMRWAGHIARIGDRRGAYRGLVGRPEGKRPFGRPRGRVEYSIKMNVVNAVMGLRVPRSVG
jgi:hypothetical protein